MLESDQPLIERWKGLKANVAKTLHSAGEFFKLSGVLNFNYGLERAKGKTTLLRSTKAVLGISQIGTSLIFQIEDDILIVSITDVLISEDTFVYDDTEDNLVIDNGEQVYAN